MDGFQRKLGILITLRVGNEFEVCLKKFEKVAKEIIIIIVTVTLYERRHEIGLGSWLYYTRREAYCGLRFRYTLYKPFNVTIHLCRSILLVYIKGCDRDRIGI